VAIVDVMKVSMVAVILMVVVVLVGVEIVMY
jgi:hypothetical protein